MRDYRRKENGAWTEPDYLHKISRMDKLAEYRWMSDEQ